MGGRPNGPSPMRYIICVGRGQPRSAGNGGEKPLSPNPPSQSNNVMATFTLFFTKNVISGEPIEACGDRSAIRLNGRMSRHNQELVSEQECRKRGYIAWQIVKGPTLTRSVPVTKVVSLYY